MRIEGETLVFSREAIRSLDRAAVEEFGLPGTTLMENAGAALEAEALEAADGEGLLCVVVCGGGNNGGDGYVCARRLVNASARGLRVVVARCSPAERVSGDAAVYMRVAERMGIEMVEAHGGGARGALEAIEQSHGRADIVVDALFGTGLDRPVEGAMSDVVSWINAQGARGAVVIAADIPSGLDCDSGRPLLAAGAQGDSGSVVRADTTVTFVGLKQGFLEESSWAYVGEVVIGDIGAPRSLGERLGRRVRL